MRAEFGRSRAPLLFSAALLVVPSAVWLFSQGSLSVFVDRYLIPTTIALALVLARMLGWLVPESGDGSAKVARWVFYASSAGFAVWAVVIACVQYPGYARYPSQGPDRSAGLIAMLPRGLPIVIEPIDVFDQMVLYHQQPGLHYVALLDWKQANAPDSLRGEVAAFHQMENWRKVGYFSSLIEDSDKFLARREPFVVVDIDSLHWFENRVRGDAYYETQLLGDVAASGGGDRYHVWLVRPRGAAK